MDAIRNFLSSEMVMYVIYFWAISLVLVIPLSKIAIIILRAIERLFNTKIVEDRIFLHWIPRVVTSGGFLLLAILIIIALFKVKE